MPKPKPKSKPKLKHRRPRVQKPARTISCFTPEWIIDRFDTEADRTGWSRSTIIREALVAKALRIKR